MNMSSLAADQFVEDGRRAPAPARPSSSAAVLLRRRPPRRRHPRARRRLQRRVGGGGHEGEEDAALAQKLGHLQPFIAVFPSECTGQLASCGPTFRTPFESGPS